MEHSTALARGLCSALLMLTIVLDDDKSHALAIGA
jgi:hypothetical protein